MGHRISPLKQWASVQGRDIRAVSGEVAISIIRASCKRHAHAVM